MGGICLFHCLKKLRFRGITHYLLVDWWGHSSVLGTADNTAFAFLLQQTERVLPIAQMEHASWRGTCFMEHVSWRGTCFMEHASWRRSLTLDLEHEQKCDWCKDATVGTSGADIREVKSIYSSSWRKFQLTSSWGRVSRSTVDVSERASEASFCLTLADRGGWWPLCNGQPKGLVCIWEWGWQDPRSVLGRIIWNHMGKGGALAATMCPAGRTLLPS